MLVSLSSAWAPGQADAYRRIIAALAALPVRAVVTTGGAELEGVLDPAPNVEVRGGSRTPGCCPVDVVVGHGGHSTTMKALAHGIPLLVLPMNPMSDQPMIGRVVQRGLGLALPRTAAPDRIRGAVAAILADPVIRAGAAAAGERLRAQRGADAAAALIESRCALPLP